MSTKKYMIVLTGQGDTYITLANPEADAWIHSPYPNMKRGSADDKIPAEVIAGYEDEVERDEVIVTTGSGNNDRAAAVPGPTFYDIGSAMTYIRDNGIEITGEYHGYVY